MDTVFPLGNIRSGSVAVYKGQHQICGACHACTNIRLYSEVYDAHCDGWGHWFFDVVLRGDPARVHFLAMSLVRVSHGMMKHLRL